MTSAKRLVRSLFHSVGLDLRRVQSLTNPAYQLALGLNRFGIDLILDVGANTGQFSLELRSFGYQGRIVSFEPLSAAHALLEKAAISDSNWQVHRRCAVGDRDGEVEINVSGNSVSSSILPILESHSSAAQGSAYVGVERVPLVRLDTVAPAYLKDGRSAFLKIDTQGFEWHVLEGAVQVLPNFRGVLCELSLVPLYEGQHLWMDVLDRLQRAGFTLWSLQPGFVDPRDGRTLQLDAIFFRS
jgi:FkbM family methyltransferase